WLGPERDLGVGDDFLPHRFDGARLRARRHEYVNGLSAVLRLREYVAECDVRQVIAVVIDVDPIDCVGMKCVRIGIRVEDNHGSVFVIGRLECVQVTQMKSLIGKRWSKAKSREMV